MKNIVKTEFKINEEKRTIVCILTTVDDFSFRAAKYGLFSEADWFTKKIYIGKAKCAPEDKWDESYGKKLAEYRASEKRKKYINRKIKEFVKDFSRKMENFEKYGMIKDSKYPEYKGE